MDELDSYYLKKLAKIYEKNLCNERLSRSDIRLLYEIDKNIYLDAGMGWKIKEPLIREIQTKRNVKKDLARIFHCRKKNIAMNMHELIEEDIYVYYGDLVWEDISLTESFKNIEVIIGNVYFEDVLDSNELANIKLIVGNLYANNLCNVEGLNNTTINGNVFFNNLISLYGLNNLNVKGSIFINNEKFLIDEQGFGRVRK